MAKSDFTKTSLQVDREIRDLVDSVDRSLDSSNGDSQRKGQLVLTAFSSLFVFVSILGFEQFVAPRSAEPQPTAASSNDTSATHELAERDKSLLSTYLSRIDTHAERIRSTKERVVPALPIDSQIDGIKSATSDSRRILGMSNEDGSHKVKSGNGDETVN